jgi:protein involved in ribonucleotide reduction
MIDVVYFTTKSGNTRRFVDKLGVKSTCIPYTTSLPVPSVTTPYILITPTYGGGHLPGAVPKPVIWFLNNPDNRALIRGVIATGNTNFGKGYGLAAAVIAEKCQVPNLGRVELFGTPADVTRIQQTLMEIPPYVT